MAIQHLLCLVVITLICYGIDISYSTGENPAKGKSKKGQKKDAKQAKKDERKAQTAAKLVSN